MPKLVWPRPSGKLQRGTPQLALPRYPCERAIFRYLKCYRREASGRTDLSFFLGLGVPDMRTNRLKDKRVCIIAVHPGGRLWTVGPPLPCFSVILTVTSGNRPGDRVAVEAAETSPSAAFIGPVAMQPVEAGHQPAEGDRALQAGQDGPQAHVHARAEGKVAIGLAGGVEAVGLGELRRVAVGGADADMDVGPGGQRLAADLEVGGEPPVAELVGALEAQAFLDAALDQAGLGLEARQFSGEAQQGVDGVADQVGR